MIEHIQARLERLRLFQSLEQDTIQSRIWGALIDEYQALLEYLSKPQPMQSPSLHPPYPKEVRYP